MPRLFPPSFTLLLDNPYLLPSLVAGLAGFAAAVSAYKYLPETLPPSLRGSVVNSGRRHEAEKADQAGGLRALLSYPRFQNVLVLYARESFLRPDQCLGKY